MMRKETHPGTPRKERGPGKECQGSHSYFSSPELTETKRVMFPAPAQCFNLYP